MQESAVSFEGHSEEIQKLLEQIQILNSEGYEEFIRLAEEQKIATESSTEAVSEETEALTIRTDATRDYLIELKKIPEQIFSASLA
jgi:hypothetical protein